MVKTLQGEPAGTRPRDSLFPAAGDGGALRGRGSAPMVRPLSAAQIEAIRRAMRVFVEDDLARGEEPHRRAYCDGCERARPVAGFIQYDRYSLCNDCATEYEIARARGIVASVGHYVRDKRFGEGEYYAL